MSPTAHPVCGCTAPMNRFLFQSFCTGCFPPNQCARWYHISTRLSTRRRSSVHGGATAWEPLLPSQTHALHLLLSLLCWSQFVGLWIRLLTPLRLDVPPIIYINYDLATVSTSQLAIWYCKRQFTTLLYDLHVWRIKS